MIKPIQDSISFGNGIQDYINNLSQNASNQELSKNVKVSESNLQKAPSEDTVEINNDNKSADTNNKPKKTSLKRKFLNVIKGFNNVSCTALGFGRGLVQGSIGAGMVGIVGKNIKENDGKIGGTLTGVFTDIGKAAGHIANTSIPTIIKEPPLENIKAALHAPVNFLTKYLSKTKLTAALSVFTFAGILGFRTIQGKMIANKKNAEVDHYTNTKH